MSKAQLILLILQTALTTLSGIPITAPEAAIGKGLVTIIQSAMAAYQLETGKPIDLTQIPQETKVS